MRLTLDEREMISISIRIHLPMELHRHLTWKKGYSYPSAFFAQMQFSSFSPSLSLSLSPSHEKLAHFTMHVTTRMASLEPPCNESPKREWERKRQKRKRNKEKRDIFANLACDWHFFSRNIQWNHQFSLSLSTSSSLSLSLSLWPIHLWKLLSLRTRVQLQLLWIIFYGSNRE